jgi:hypothetical protein
MNPSVIPFVFVAAVAVIAAAALLARQLARRREAYIDAYGFPQGIRTRVRRRYAHLTEAQLDLVFEALRDYFHLCRGAGRQLLAMPSQVVDVAWHEFILFTRNYRTFCDRALGRFLHHTPAEAMRAPTEATEGIRRTWFYACKRSGIDPRQPRTLPLLFAIDTQLNIPDGFRYVPNCAPLRDGATYCGSHIGSGSGCGGSSCGGSSCSGDGGGGCGGGGGD